MARRRLIRSTTALLVAVALWTTGTATSLAHASFVSSDPPDGATLDTAPSRIRLTFSDAVALDFTTIELRDGDNQVIPPVAVRYGDGVGADEDASGDVPRGHVIVVDVPMLAPNSYQLRWQTRAKSDLHLIAGTLTFGVQRDVSAIVRQAESERPSIVEVGFRWLSFAGLAGVLGALAFALALLPTAAKRRFEGTSETADRTIATTQLRLMRWVVGSCLVVFVAECGVLWALAGRDNADGNAWRLILTKTTYGTRWLTAQALTAVLGWAALLLQRMKAFELSSRFPHQRGHRNWERVAWVILTPLTLALVSAHVLLNGHAAGTASTSTTQASIAIDSLHIGAAGIWVGGLLVAVGVIVPLARRGWLDATVAWVVLRGFAWLAAVCLVVLVSTGLYKTGQRVASVDALVLTLFGKALLVKLVLVACVALIGLINTSVLHPSVADVFARMLRRPVGWTLIAPRRLRRLVFVEAAGAVIVLLFGALLASAPPARGPEFEAVSGASLPSEPVTMRVDDLWVGVSVKPNQPGPSFLRVDVYNTRRPAPAPISNVMARLEAPDGHERDVALMLVPGASASYQATGSLFTVPGRWNVVITVDRLGMPPTNTRVPWMVGDGTLRGNRRETLLSSRPLEGLLTIGAALVTLVSGLGLAAIRFRGPVADSLSYVRATLLSRYHPSVAKEDL